MGWVKIMKIRAHWEGHSRFGLHVILLGVIPRASVYWMYVRITEISFCLIQWKLGAFVHEWLFYTLLKGFGEVNIQEPGKCIRDGSRGVDSDRGIGVYYFAGDNHTNTVFFVPFCMYVMVYLKYTKALGSRDLLPAIYKFRRTEMVGDNNTRSEVYKFYIFQTKEQCEEFLNESVLTMIFCSHLKYVIFRLAKNLKWKKE